MLLKLFPCGATIIRAIQAAARTAVRKRPGHAASLPERSENDIRILRIECDIDPSGVLIFIKNLFPGFAAVKRTENTTLNVWAVGMAKCRDQHPVGIFR